MLKVKMRPQLQQACNNPLQALKEPCTTFHNAHNIYTLYRTLWRLMINPIWKY